MPETAQERETQRLEAFSDGVFAITITLLVLEIKVPHLEEGATLSGALLRLWPSYAAYAFSFLMIGISGSITTASFAFSGAPITLFW
jgi:uncharacterized membrane protein